MECGDIIRSDIGWRGGVTGLTENAEAKGVMMPPVKGRIQTATLDKPGLGVEPDRGALLLPYPR